MIFEEINGIQTGSGLKIVIYGQEGVGKSTLASQFPGAVFIDCEGSTSRMNVRRLPKPTSWKMFTDEFEYILSSCKANGYKTAIVDTFDWAERLALEALCTEHNVTGIEGMNYGKGWEYEKEMIGRFLDGTDRLIKEGVNIVLLCHAISRKTTLPEETEEFDHWELKLGNKTTNKIAPLLKEWSDMTLFLAFRTNIIAVDDKGKKHKATSCERIMYTTKTAWWDAKNRFGMPDKLPLTWESLAPIFGSAPAAETAPPVNVPPAQQVIEKAQQAGISVQPVKDGVPDVPNAFGDFVDITPTSQSYQRVQGIPDALADLMQQHIITNKNRLSLSAAEIISVMHKYPVAYFPKFSAQILNDTAHILVLIYEKIFSPDCRPCCAETAPYYFTIIS